MSWHAGVLDVVAPGGAALQTIPESASWSTAKSRAQHQEAAWKLPLESSADVQSGVLSIAPGLSPGPELHAAASSHPPPPRPTSAALTAQPSQGFPLQRTVIGYPEASGTLRSGSLPAARQGRSSTSEIVAAPAHTPDDALPALPTPFAAPEVQSTRLSPPPAAAQRGSVIPVGAGLACVVEPTVAMAMVALGLRMVRGHLEPAGLANDRGFCPLSLNTYTWPTQRWDVNRRCSPFPRGLGFKGLGLLALGNAPLVLRSAHL